MITKGLCDDCSNQRITHNKRGSRFSMCELGRTDPDYLKYPPLPVRECSGFTPKAPDGEQTPQQKEHEGQGRS